MSSAQKRTRNSIPIETKIKILEQVDSGKEKKLIAQEFELPFSTLSTIIGNREKIYGKVAEGKVKPQSKRLKKAEHEDLEDEILEWFDKVRSNNIPVTGAVVQEKMRSVAASKGIEEFKGSNGWLWNFQKRHGLTSQFTCGEANKVDETAANNWLTLFEEIKKKFSPSNIFNMDESGIFYKLLPNRTLSYKGEKCHGGTRSKERVTAVFICNSNGTEKFPLWVIGKWENPHCLKNLDRSKLPCHYSHQTNAWIDGKAFRKWLLEFNSKMAKKNRKVLLTLDNCKAHDISNLNLSHVTVQFFPANMTCRLQPLDMGIIAMVKSNFRKLLVRASINAIDTGKKCKWNVYDAMTALASSWNQVSSDAIQKCFNKAWTNSETEVEIPVEAVIEECEDFVLLQSADSNFQVSKTLNNGFEIFTNKPCIH